MKMSNVYGMSVVSWEVVVRKKKVSKGFGGENEGEDGQFRVRSCECEKGEAV